LSKEKNGNTLDLDSTLSTEDYGEISIEEEVAKNEIIGILLRVIETELTEKEKLIIKHRFGINAVNKTQNELAQMVNMSQANISKLGKNIMDKIKKIMISKYKIKSFDF
jgi:RNA polymerase sigma factor (sigma-70 family)